MKGLAGKAKLAQVIYSRDNNLNLLRLLAASMVLLSHSFALVTGNVEMEPWRLDLGLTPGSMAVDIFFIVSGMLVTASIRRTESALDFVSARAFRIVPGLFVALTVTVLSIGTVYYRGDLVALVRSTDALWYIVRNSIPIGELTKSISGDVIFAGNPIGNEFNGSLWTLPIEIGMYGVLLAGWLASRLAPAPRRAFAWMIAIALVFVALMHAKYVRHGPVEYSLFRLPFMFFAGCAASVGARFVRLSWLGLALACAVILVSCFEPRVFFLAYSFGLWYVVIGLAYLPAGAVRAYNRVGDYSYGMYIYAWPVQQALVAAFPEIGIAAHMAASAAITLALAAASWHGIEEPALRWRRRIVWRRQSLEVAR